jgi:uncharacterized protein (TIGR03083 family)
MEIAEHIDALVAEGTALAEAADKAGLDSGVPPCPGWTVADLIRHTGYVHRWAARNVAEQPAEPIDEHSEEQVLNGGPNDERLIPWFRDGFAALADTLRTADPAGPCPVFLPNTTSPLAFWARRQAHETAIHRADADLAAGQIPAYDSGLRGRRDRRADHGLRRAQEAVARGHARPVDARPQRRHRRCLADRLASGARDTRDM